MLFKLQHCVREGACASQWNRSHSDTDANVEAHFRFVRNKVDLIFTVRRYASAVYAVVVRLCVCLIHASIASKPINVGSRKQRHTIAQELYFCHQRSR